MQLAIVAIKDLKTGTFMAPGHIHNVAAAVRDFETGINRPDENSNLYMYPSDFELWKLGTWDDITGEFVNKQEFVIAGSSVQRSVTKEY